MNSREEYLKLAKAAEVHEQQSIDFKTRAAWEKIVVGYLELAEISCRSANDTTITPAGISNCIIFF